MQGKKLFLDKAVVRFRLSERVRPHNLYRRLAEWVDWSFLYDVTRSRYRHTGQPSLDSVVFFKLVFMGHPLGLPAAPVEAHLCARGQAQTTHPHPLRRRVPSSLAAPADPARPAHAPGLLAHG